MFKLFIYLFEFIYLVVALPVFCEVEAWLSEEFAASLFAEHTALDSVLHGRRPGRSPFKREDDLRVVPGIFSDEALGATRYVDSRCYREGRVLHYVILSTDLKPTLNWRPDPLGAHAAYLLTEDTWRPCLLRLNARSVRYFLRKSDFADGDFPEWDEQVFRDHDDVVEYKVDYFFLDRITVEMSEREGLVTLFEKDPDPGTVQPDCAPTRLPLVFRVNLEYAYIWEKIVLEYRMVGREEQIVNYKGPVKEHSHLPGVYVRHGPEGEQLWDDGSRYLGEWEDHTYHGHGRLVNTQGAVVYEGQWCRGMKHGRGTYFFEQEATEDGPASQRKYQGEFFKDEFRGQGELAVLRSTLGEVAAAQPYAVVWYRGRFDVADGQFDWPPSLVKLELDKHAALVRAHFPTRPLEKGPSDFREGAPAVRATVQYGGAHPRDNCLELYRDDGMDLWHCGPDACCDVEYADGGRYTGPCLRGAIPHGNQCTFIEPDGTEYRGSFYQGMRSNSDHSELRLPNGILYKGRFLYGEGNGERHGPGQIQIPPNLYHKVGFLHFEGSFGFGFRHGEGKMRFDDGSVYRGTNMIINNSDHTNNNKKKKKNNDNTMIRQLHKEPAPRHGPAPAAGRRDVQRALEGAARCTRDAIHDVYTHMY